MDPDGGASVGRCLRNHQSEYERGRDRQPISVLRYAKAESIRVIRWMYYAPDVPCLARKRAKAERFLSPLGRARGRHVGRPRAGWLYNVGPDGVDS